MVIKHNINATKIEIIKVALKMFLEKGYSKTSAKAICDELKIKQKPLNVVF